MAASFSVCLHGLTKKIIQYKSRLIQFEKKINDQKKRIKHGIESVKFWKKARWRWNRHSHERRNIVMS